MRRRMTTNDDGMSRRALSSLRGFAARVLAPPVAPAREYSGYRVVTPHVPSWRTGDDAVTALSWLRKHLRHAPPGLSASARSSDESDRARAPHGGAAVFKLFRDRRVRVGSGEFESNRIEDVRRLRRASRARVLEPGEFLAVPDGANDWYWRTWSESDDASSASTSSSRSSKRGAKSHEELGEALRACVLHQDAHVTIINKPPGLATVPGVGNDISVYDLLPALDSQYIVHRLDRDTSGVLVLARTSFAANKLNAMFRRKSKLDFTEVMREQMERGEAPEAPDDDDFVKTYWAICSNPPPRGASEGWVEAPLVEVADVDAGDGRETVRLVGGWRVYDAEDGGVIVGAGDRPPTSKEEYHSKAAITHFTVLSSAPREEMTDESGPTLLQLTPITGRKHQIRVHVSKALNAPIVGDNKYGAKSRESWTRVFQDIEKSERERSDDPWRTLRRASLRGPSKPPLHLHARALRFTHPESGETLRIVADPPPHFNAALAAFRLGTDDAPC